MAGHLWGKEKWTILVTHFLVRYSSIQYNVVKHFLPTIFHSSFFISYLLIQGVNLTSSELNTSQICLFHEIIRETVLKVFFPRHWEVSPWSDLLFQVLFKQKQTMTVWFSAVPETVQQGMDSGVDFSGREREGFKLIKKSVHDTMLNLHHPNIWILINLPVLSAEPA